MSSKVSQISGSSPPSITSSSQVESTSSTNTNKKTKKLEIPGLNFLSRAFNRSEKPSSPRTMAAIREQLNKEIVTEALINLNRAPKIHRHRHLTPLPTQTALINSVARQQVEKWDYAHQEPRPPSTPKQGSPRPKRRG